MAMEASEGRGDVLSAWGRNMEVMSALDIPTPIGAIGPRREREERLVVFAGMLRVVC